LQRCAHASVAGARRSRFRQPPDALEHGRQRLLGVRVGVDQRVAHELELAQPPAQLLGIDLRPGEKFVTEYRSEPMGVHGLHKWWYACLQRAGVVATGQTSGERMHKARHTAGQRVLDKTQGNLKAVQKLLGHSSISTTGDIYTDWDIDQLADTLRSILEESNG
jgi:integrase